MTINIQKTPKLNFVLHPYSKQTSKIWTVNRNKVMPFDWSLVAGDKLISIIATTWLHKTMRLWWVWNVSCLRRRNWTLHLKKVSLIWSNVYQIFSYIFAEFFGVWYERCSARVRTGSGTFSNRNFRLPKIKWKFLQNFCFSMLREHNWISRFFAKFIGFLEDFLLFRVKNFRICKKER